MTHQTNAIAIQVCADFEEVEHAKDLLGLHKCDTDKVVRFYEQDHYYLSNFSSFEVQLDVSSYLGELGPKIITFKTSEHAYHWHRFAKTGPGSALLVRDAASAHEAFEFSQNNKHNQRCDWNDVKVEVMHKILRAKVIQHPYIQKKLPQTTGRELIEDSWRDPFWGWGEDRRGQNMLGKLWMQVRDEFMSETTHV